MAVMTVLSGAWSAAVDASIVPTTTGERSDCVAIAVAAGEPERVCPPARSASDDRLPAMRLPALAGTGPGRSPEAPIFHSRLTGFPTSGGQVTGRRQGLWVKDTQNRTRAMGAQIQSFTDVSRHLMVESAYLDRAAGDTTSTARGTRSDVWGVALRSRWLDERLWFHGEYAASRQRRDAAYAQARQESGTAYNLFARFGDVPDGGDDGVSWGVTLDRRRADATFWTLADPNVPQGQVVDRLSTTFSARALTGRVGIVRATDVRQGDAGAEAWQRNAVEADLAYRGESLSWLPAGTMLFGEPRYTVSLRRETREPLWSAATTAGHYTESAGLTAAFDPRGWRWEVGYLRALDYEDEGRVPVTTYQRTRVTLDVPLGGGRVILRPELQWKTSSAYRGDDGTSILQGGLGSTATIIPRCLSAEFRIDANRHFDVDDAVDTRMLALQSRVEWQLPWQPSVMPAVTVSVTGRYRYRDDATVADRDTRQYAAYAALEIAWPGGE